MDYKKAHFDYLLRLADNALVLGQRLGEWCGHGPVLEQDIALSNTGLDFIGQSIHFFQRAANLENAGRTEDHLAMQRDAPAFRNFNLVEQPNGDWAETIARQFFFDAFDVPNLEWLSKNSNDDQLRAIAEKALKEAVYHLRWSSEWVVRLGDGTDFSRQKMQSAIDEAWMFTGELFEKNATDEACEGLGIAPNLLIINELWTEKVDAVLGEATLKKPKNGWTNFYLGKNGQHTEHLGFVLADLQFLQRTYPGLEW